MYYTAQLSQRGISVRQSGMTRMEAITRCLQEYMCYLKG